MKNIKLFENFNQDAKDLGIDIKPGTYDGKDISIWTVQAAEGQKFQSWERAMDFLIELWKKDDNMYNYFRGELGTSDEVIVGDETFVGIDVQDHMTLDEDNTPAGQGESAAKFDNSYNNMVAEFIPLANDPAVRKAVKETTESFKWEPDEIIAMCYGMLVEINEHDMAKDFVALAKKHY